MVRYQPRAETDYGNPRENNLGCLRKGECKEDLFASCILMEKR